MPFLLGLSRDDLATFQPLMKGDTLSPSTIVVTPDHLDAFVVQSDALGGPGAPGCQGYWERFQYAPVAQVDQSLDPYSEAYVASQLDLYRELSGKEFDQVANEHTPLDVLRHAAAVNPYDHPDPSALAVHTERLSRAFRFARVPRGARLLDLGCGWGLSSEVAAYLGLRVEAVDINPLFVDLVNQRALSGRRNIVARVSTFDTFEPASTFDMVLFYECLHHALRPWDVIKKFASCLAPGGKIVIAGEPINDIWWRHWGMRLDPISVYCIRKFGWCESGWSLEFIQDVFRRAGLAPEVYLSSDAEVGYTIVARTKPPLLKMPSLIASSWNYEGWQHDADYLTFLGSGWIDLQVPDGTTGIRLEVKNFRPANAIPVMMRIDGHAVFCGPISPGDSVIDFRITPGIARLECIAEEWSPNAELGNGDGRKISFHLAKIQFT